MSALVRVTSQVVATPTATPASDTHRKLPIAPCSGNAPVRAAATATRMQTRPDASLNSD